MFKLTFVVLLAVIGLDAKVSVRFKDAGCVAINPKVAALNECNVKAYSKKVTALNIAATFLVPLDDPFMVQGTISKFNGSDFVQMMKGPNVEWCSFIKTWDSNYVYKFMFDLVRDSCPNLFKRCPIVGRMDYLNITIDDTKLKMMVPSGLFKAHASMALDKSVFAEFWFTFDVK